jgi:hypothetical protein
VDESAAHFKLRLIRRAGLSESAVNAAWPDWWSESADASPSAQAELRFSVARNLGLDPRSLLDEETPRFVWDDTAKYKGFTGHGERDRPALSSFGTALSRSLVAACPVGRSLVGISAAELRQSILASRPFVGLPELLGAAWALGIPVIHLRVYPLAAKRMSAMCVPVNDRQAILMARDAVYPAWPAFHLAHELGHIAQGHLADGRAIVDLDAVDETTQAPDAEELAANAFALELLTGRPEPRVVVQGAGRGARQLADQAREVGQQERIEPGTLALVYGHATGQWTTASAALSHLYEAPQESWRPINNLANRQLHWDTLSDDAESYVRAVMGGVPRG